MISLGKKLRAFARDLGLSDAEVARRTGLTERRYGHYVTGAREPDLATFLRICKTLGCTPNELLDWADADKKVTPHDKLRARLISASQCLAKPHLEFLIIEAEALAKHS